MNCTIWFWDHVLEKIKMLRVRFYLAVADFGVAMSVGSQDAAKSRDPGVALECWVFWERAMQISLNLITRKRAAAHTLLQ